MWPIVDGAFTLLSKYKKMPGRHKKIEKKERFEEENTTQRSLSKAGMQMTYQYYLENGHNKRACPRKDQPPAERPPKVNG